MEVLDPTHGGEPARFVAALRPAALDGATVGIVSNGKQGTRPFFDALEAELRSRHGVADVVRVTKADSSAPAEAPIMDRASRWNALVAGIGD